MYFTEFYRDTTKILPTPSPKRQKLPGPEAQNDHAVLDIKKSQVLLHER